MKRRVLVQAPSNIAVIKYMGKKEGSSNLPENPSLSLTLSSLASITEVIWQGPGEFDWDWKGASSFESVTGKSVSGLRPLDLSTPEERQKIQKHLERVALALSPELREQGLGQWKIRSGNRFPAGAGIASSASGFAALTLGVAAALSPGTPDPAALSSLSRMGSGSSCRSMAGPWVAWQEESTRVLKTPSLVLADLVLVVDEGKKTVGSSQAHLRVKGSPLWAGRIEAVLRRFRAVREILESDALSSRWGEFSQLCFEEAMEMHELFHTSAEPFSYWTPQTREILKWLESERTLPVAITLDAGPNIHLLTPLEKVAEVRRSIQNRFRSLVILEDRQGLGASVLQSEWI